MNIPVVPEQDECQVVETMPSCGKESTESPTTHHKKKKALDRDVVIGMPDRKGNKALDRIIETIFDDSGGAKFNSNISNAIRYELSAHHRRVLVKISDDPEDLSLEARLASKQEREEFFEERYTMVSEKRYSVKPPHEDDVVVCNEDHCGNEAFRVVLKDYARGVEAADEFSVETYKKIMGALKMKHGHSVRFLDRPHKDVPWRELGVKDSRAFVEKELELVHSELQEEWQEEDGDLEDVPVAEAVPVPLSKLENKTKTPGEQLHVSQPPGSRLPDSQPPASQTTVSRPSVVIVTREPTRIRCPYCNRSGMTSVRHVNGATVFCYSIVICISCWPLTCVPFLVPSYKRTVHRCRHCDKVLGVIEPAQLGKTWIAIVCVVMLILIALALAS